MNLKRLFLYLLIASVAVSALLGIGALLIGEFGELSVRVLLTTLTVTVTSILGLACGVYYESGRGRYLPMAGITFTITATLMTFLIIWNVLGDNKTFIKSTVTMMMLAVSFSHLSLLSMARLDRRFAWSRLAAFVFVTMLDAILLFILWFEPSGESDVITRTIGVLSILIASVTVMTPVFHKLSHGESKSEIETIDTEIDELRQRLDKLEARKTELTRTISE